MTPSQSFLLVVMIDLLFPFALLGRKTRAPVPVHRGGRTLR